MIRTIAFAILFAAPAIAQHAPVPDANMIRDDPRLDLEKPPLLIVMMAIAAAEDPDVFARFPATSTITQQIAKTYLPESRTISRRVMTFHLAIDIANTFTAEQIMTLYSQSIYLGARCFGFADAFEQLLGVNIDDATLRNALTLAVRIKRPSLPDIEPKLFNIAADHGASAGFWDETTRNQLVSDGRTPFIDGATCPSE